MTWNVESCLFTFLLLHFGQRKFFFSYSANAKVKENLRSHSSHMNSYTGIASLLLKKLDLVCLTNLCTWCFSCLYTKVDAVSESDHAYTLLLSLWWITVDRIDHDYSSTHILIIRSFRGSTNRSGCRFCQTGSTSFPVPSLSWTVAAIPGQEIAAL